MENEKNEAGSKKNSAPDKEVVKTRYQKTVHELERRNAHLHTKPNALKAGKKNSSV